MITRTIIIFLLKFIVKRMNKSIKFIKQFKIIAPVFSAIHIIKENWNAIKSLTLYRYFRFILRVLSSISLLISIAMLIVFMDLNNIDLTIPALSWLFSSIFLSFPYSFQDYFISIFTIIKGFIYDIYLKVKFIILQILRNITPENVETPKDDDIPSDAKNVEIPKDVDIPSDAKNVEEGDIVENEKENINKKPDSIKPFRDKYKTSNEDLGDKISYYNYITYIIAGVLVISSGVLIWYYWDNISSVFRRKPKGGGDPTTPGNESITDSLPSDASMNHPDPTYYRYFRNPFRSTKDIFNKWRAKEQAKRELENYIPKGISLEKGKAMWNGLPLPRTEYLEDGTEYYITLDQDKFIRIYDNRIESSVVDIINPVSGKSIGRQFVSASDKLEINSRLKDIKSYFRAPEDSYIRNPLIDI